MNSPDSKPVTSANFAFLARHDPLLVRYAALAERFVFEDPNTALIKLGQFGEFLAQRAAASAGVYVADQDKQIDVLARLKERGVLSQQAAELFHSLRKYRNAAVHEHAGDRREALHQLKMARSLAVWFHKAFGKAPKFKAGPFVAPPDPAEADQALREELSRLREAAVKQKAKLSEAEAKAAQAYAETQAALELAEETKAESDAAVELYEERIAELQATTAAAPAEAVETAVQQAFELSAELDLDEQDTRRIIDEQLREVGWTVDSTALSYSNGARPQKGKNLAIAEWPTESGPADYVLFTGLTPLAVVEAKRKRKDVPGAIEQAKRYSRGYAIQADETLPGGPWGDYKTPFLFATNGRRFLKQIATKSGIWFLDGRRSTNHSRALDGWYSPEGLTQLRKQDIGASDQQLAEEPTDYLPLRTYQHEAIKAVENAIADGKRQLLLAMATGTGKTRTAICMIYRLIKAGRFRRILFLVDRTALGEQATNAFKDVKLESLRSFTDIYDVKELGDIKPDADTRLQIATIQGMVKRLLYAADDTDPVPVDQYDCIVVDECHRGYNLDQEMSDAELSSRSETDYISKYTRVLDHFDAVKIGLTATPALHTTNLFCDETREPVFEYSYRQAVIDGYLVDHEPPFRITTKLAAENIKWKQGEVMKVYHTLQEQLELFNVPDDVEMDVDKFNRQVITENFNRTVCTALADHIDPHLLGKTLVFCATDGHADMVVVLLTKAFEARYGAIDDDMVKKREPPTNPIN